MKQPLIVILGPTASGKTRLAVQLAGALGTEIIGADSRQVYRGMDIGTGKDLKDYVVSGRRIPVHLTDIAEPEEDFHLTAFLTHFYRVYDEIRAQGMVPVLCGGSALYIDSILRGYHFAFVPVNPEFRKQFEFRSRRELEQYFLLMPETAYTAVADTSTAKRLIRAIEINQYLLSGSESPRRLPVFEPVVFGINPPLATRRENIEKRLHQRLNEGLIGEVEQLLTRVSPEKLIRFGLEYKFVTLFLTGELPKDEMISRLTIAIQQFAKRQMTYFRKMERDGLTIHWIDYGMKESERLAYMMKVLGA